MSGAGRGHVDAVSELLLVGISHRVAPVALRERVALTERQADALHRVAVREPEVSEAVAISTCNRTELYVVRENARRRRARSWWRALAAHAEIARRRARARRLTRRATATPRGTCSA